MNVSMKNLSILIGPGNRLCNKASFDIRQAFYKTLWGRGVKKI